MLHAIRQKHGYLFFHLENLTRYRMVRFEQEWYGRTLHCCIFCGSTNFLINSKTKGLMKKTYLLLVLIVMVTLGQQAAVAQFINGQNANVVLGQPNFTSNIAATTQSGMSGPSGVEVDSATGKVFVADWSNNRVLRFSSVTAAANGSAAEAVLGQPNFTSSTADTTQNGMSRPNCIAIDASGNLYVVDQYSNRVLRFNDAATKANGANADGVLGQPDFTSSGHTTTQGGMMAPIGVAVDAAGNLYVGEAGNNRVLRFNNAASKPNGANADGVLGQPDFTSNAPATTQSGMYQTNNVAVDGSGNLFVADYHNNRVLRFNNAASKPNGANADGVLGQLGFTDSTSATTQSGMKNPSGLAVDRSGSLFVADNRNNRVLRFNNAASKPNEANADGVLGQADFTSNASATTQSGMHGPNRLGVDVSGNLYVSDGGNNRVLRFNATSVGVPVQGVKSAVREFKLLQNYPNPFNPATVISYQLAVSSQITLRVYDVLGREVATLVNERQAAGSYTASFDASRFSSGVYFYRLEAGSFVQTKKMLLVK
jgi:sugar lactone lactonase YvrE